MFADFDNVEGAKGHVKLVLSPSGPDKLQTNQGIGSKTIIRKLESSSPFLVQRAIYPDTALPQMSHIYLMSSSGGVLQGDRLTIDITLEPGSASRITTQASTKIYKMEKGFATQKINITVNKGSYLEFVPHPTIPFKASRFYQEAKISVSDGGTVIYTDTVVAGRIAYGEKFDFEVFATRTSVTDSLEKLLFLDSIILQPSKLKADLRMENLDRLFANRDVLSSIYLVSSRASNKQLVDKIDSIIKKKSGQSAEGRLEDSDAIDNDIAGWSLLPNKAGVLVRMLSNSTDATRALLDSIIQLARQHLLLSIEK